jgi:hypothetical protein
LVLHERGKLHGKFDHVLGGGSQSIGNLRIFVGQIENGRVGSFFAKVGIVQRVSSISTSKASCISCVLFYHVIHHKKVALGLEQLFSEDQNVTIAVISTKHQFGLVFPNSGMIETNIVK